MLHRLFLSIKPGTVQSRTGKVDPARKFKCTTAARGSKNYIFEKPLKTGFKNTYLYGVYIELKIIAFYSRRAMKLGALRGGGQNFNCKFKTFDFLDIRHKYIKVHIQSNFLYYTILYLSFIQN